MHRIGRTGRFGAQGIAVSIVSKDADMDFLEEIYRRYKKDDTAVLEDLIHNLPLARVEVAFDEVSHRFFGKDRRGITSPGRGAGVGGTLLSNRFTHG